MEIAVIGGGASGLMAAICAGESGASVTVYEKEKRVGRKILATGNGRCNMTNINAKKSDYHGSDTNFMDGVIKRQWVKETLSFFEDTGVLWKTEEEGKVYPFSDTASSVLDLLRRRAQSAGVKVECEFAVESVRKTKSRFLITSRDGQVREADRVIVATGGKASPTLGSDGSGYEILKDFGHSVTKLTPSLVQLRTETETVRKLKGIKTKAKLTLGDHSRTGELLFTDYGISGPPVFSLSAYLNDNEYITIDLMCDYSWAEVYDMLLVRVGMFYDTELSEFFTGMLNNRIGQALLKHAKITPLSRKAKSLSQKELSSLTDAIKSLTLKIEGTHGFLNAQVTKGGVRCSEFSPVTLESKLTSGLFACGEVLDIDGDCGGYNLQWAWSSGYIAGKSASR